MKLFVHKAPVVITRSTFPGGETHMSIGAYDHSSYILSDGELNVKITCNFKSNSDLIDLLLLTDAVREKYGSMYKLNIVLEIPYFPYARQDRVCNPGEPLSVRVIAKLINSQGYSKVYITDAHSDVTPALINNVVHIDLSSAAYRLRDAVDPDRDNCPILVAPDAGALKKVYAFAKKNGYPEVVRADKRRNTVTLEILGTEVYCGDVGDRNFLIVDDICDGGRTFIELAKVLRTKTTGKIFLYVTHGIFSYGVAVFDGLIDRVLVSNLIGEADDLITVL